MAKYVLNWKLRQGGTAQQNHDDGERLLATFSKWQPPADQNFLQFLQRIDGEGGVAVVESEGNGRMCLESTPIAAAAAEFRKSV